MPIPDHAIRSSNNKSTQIREASRVLSLDGMRAVSIMLVVLGHSGLEQIVPGGFGVTLFFFISGYLITGQLVAEHDSTGRLAFGRFYLRRILRLMPASTAFICLVTVLWWILVAPVPPSELAAASLYYANYYYLLVFSPSFDAPIRQMYLILWSLAVEEHFYLVWPWILACCLPRGRSALWVAVGACFAILFWRMCLFTICSAGASTMCGLGPLWLRFYQGTDTRLDSILFGAVLALMIRYGLGRFVAPRIPTVATATVLLLSTFLLRGEEFRDVWRYTIQGLALLVLVPAILASQSLPRRVLEWPVLVWIGQLSYSLYLFHWAGYMLADGLEPARGALWLCLALFFAAAFTLASYYGIERPMVAIRARVRNRQTAIVSAPWMSPSETRSESRLVSRG